MLLQASRSSVALLNWPARAVLSPSCVLVLPFLLLIEPNSFFRSLCDVIIPEWVLLTSIIGFRRGKYCRFTTQSEENMKVELHRGSGFFCCHYYWPVFKLLKQPERLYLIGGISPELVQALLQDVITVYSHAWAGAWGIHSWREDGNGVEA